MNPGGFEHIQPRTYLLGRRFRLRPGENTMGVDIIDRNSFPLPETDRETALNEEKKIDISGTMAALWRSLTTKQPGGFIMDKLRRARAVINNLQHLSAQLSPARIISSGTRHFYGKDVQYPVRFSEQDIIFRGPRAGQYHIAYQDPSPNPRWRMKQIVEFADDRDIGRRFLVSGSNMAWIFRNTSQGGRNFGVYNLPNGVVTWVPEPLW